MVIQNESYIIPHTDNGPHKDDDDHHSNDVTIILPESHKAYGNMHANSINNRVSFVADNDNTQTDSSDAIHLLTTTKPAKQNLTSAPEHPLYMYINDILLTSSISLSAHSHPLYMYINDILTSSISLSAHNHPLYMYINDILTSSISLSAHNHPLYMYINDILTSSISLSAHSHPLYMYINDILLTSSISLSAHHLLNSLVITGPIPLPLFYVEELNNVVMNTVYSQEKKMLAESPMKELVKLGVTRSSSYAMVYRKNLNPDYIDTTIQLMIVPQLICEAVKDQMDDTDKALSVLSVSVQCALENMLMYETTSLIHLRYILILCDHLDEVCSQVSNHLLTTNLKQKLQMLRL